ncbi:mesaconyl-C4 hydratase [Pyrenophora seminiperda CCB06]|uniref:Mesaconyl-C4 hydratase n=1 Tax=Pyrenophora seminiperda CCB06 TaxID=1302712 RepID=A0A3M7M5N2_9PLEO|nr:mesaconyl-C4 hydratase [Pyrenophora seminiperda CCB06]
MDATSPLPMLLRTRWTRQIGSTLPRRTPWRSTPVRCYASKNSEESLLWFKELRAEMLRRPLIYLPEHINATREDQLCQTLRGILPPHFCHAPKGKEIIPVGHHLIWFNPATPTNELLPDGTDTLHSPGHPWVRRLWAGGAIRVRPEEYYHRFGGFANETPMLGVEEISEVKLHGEGDDAKIFVTIERHFVRQATVEERYFAKHGLLGRTHTARSNIFKYFADQLLADRVHKRERWGEAALQEQRTLVFLKKHNNPQISQTLPTKYLSPPNSECDFSQVVHPNRTLLFRFSALTFNAHRIHLDPDYARNVEGHRNLLVHGPLSLTLLLQVFNAYLAEHTDGVQAVVSIEYRNIAPLYCDERMRICGSRKKTVLNGAVYDVWIEGPTGGVAVRGTIYTCVRRGNPEAIQTAIQNGSPFKTENESTFETENKSPFKMESPSKTESPFRSKLRFNPIKTEESPQENSSSENSPTPRGLSFVRLQDPRLRGRMASALNGLDRLEKKNIKAQRNLLFKDAENTIGEEEKALKYQKLLETLEAEEKATENEKVTIAARRERERFKNIAKKQLKATERALSKLSKLNTSPDARDPAELQTTSEVGQQQPPSQQPQGKKETLPKTSPLSMKKLPFSTKI